jgi:thioredoxin 1
MIEKASDGGRMNRVLSAVIATIALSLLVGLIIVWSVHQKREVVELQDHVKRFTDENFELEVVKASMIRPVLVDFYAEWCSPCKMLDPVIRQVASDLKDRAVIGKLDTDKNLIARRFGINRIPTIFIIRDGEIKDAFFGLVPKETLIKALGE